MTYVASTRCRRWLGLVLTLLVGVLLGLGDARSQEAVDRDAILNHLNGVISWYRSSTSQIQTVGLPSDAIYRETARSLALEAVRLAVQAARAQASLALPGN